MIDRRAFALRLVPLAALAGGLPAMPADDAPSSAPAPRWLQTDAFYSPTAPMAGERGDLLGSEALAGRDLPPGSRGWRIRYLSPLPNGDLTLAIATVIAPDPLPAAPMPMVVFAHGTVGVRQECLPSVVTVPFMGVPALPPALSEGWIVVAPDYVTGGRHGVHPFMIGPNEATSVIDAVRAVRQIPGLSLGGQTVVWGHSQGGHAALWTGAEAPSTAPDIRLAGVVAIAPATDIIRILAHHAGTPKGAILSAYGALSYTTWYPDVRFEEIVTPGTEAIARSLADLCQFDPADQEKMGAIVAGLAGREVLIDPSSGALGKRLRENEPTGDVSVPVLIAQGLDDAVVTPDVTDDFVAARCAAGQSLTYWRAAGLDHGGIVQPGSPLEAPLVAWTRDRFLGVPVPAGCTTCPLPGTV